MGENMIGLSPEIIVVKIGTSVKTVLGWLDFDPKRAGVSLTFFV